jgi:hypothetical protein
VPVVTPEGLVDEGVLTEPPSLAPTNANDTGFPPMRLPLASLTVIVMVEVLVNPITVAGEAVTVESVALGAPGATVTLAGDGVTVTPPTVICAEIDLVSALVEV